VHNHAPEHYHCPFCWDKEPLESEHPLEILHQYDGVWVKMQRWWLPGNPGGALVLPNEHFENIYDLPVDLGAPLQQAIRDTALAMRQALHCDGISVRQNNEPAGGQEVWHSEDRLDQSQWEQAEPGQMRRLAELLRAAWPS
jgi:histidine triad (HIT) family protein